MAQHSPHKVVAVVYDGLCTFEFGLAVEVFGTEREELGGHYAFSACSIDPMPLRAAGGLTVHASTDLRRIRNADTVIVPGWRHIDEAPPQRLLNSLRAAHENGARLVSFCSGAFVLAATGLLNGRRATTHWRYAEALAHRHPEIELDPGVLYVRDGSLFTSAGSAAGIDLSLHLVRLDLGARVANAMARRLVVSAHRDGGQAQFIRRAVTQPESDGLSRLMDRVRKTLHKHHTVQTMAGSLHVSPRTLARRFEESVGSTPHRWLIYERVLYAQQLLESGRDPIDRIAERAGFADPQLLRLHFRRQVGTTPSAYRASFRTRA